MNGWTLGHRRGLDGLRGVAIALVLLLHWWPSAFPGGDTGVDLFFVLSGFLITRLLIEERRRTGRVSLRGFYTRRARRLFPALAVVVTACAGSPGVWWVVGYAANWGRINGAIVGGPLEHTWSLAIEEQFYLVWPLMFLALAKLRRPALLVGLAVAALALHRAGMDADWLRLTAGTDSRADGLLVGCVGAFVVNHAPRVGRIAPLVVVPLGWVVLTAPDLTRFGFTFVAGGWLVVLAWVLDRDSVAPLRWLGERSYSLYLWHYPITWALRDGDMHSGGVVATGLAIAGSFAAATASYELVEKRFRRSGHRRVSEPQRAYLVVK